MDVMNELKIKLELLTVSQIGMIISDMDKVVE